MGLEAFNPTPFNSANAVGMLKKKADELGVKKVSDLEGKSQNLTLYGSPECRQRPDRLVGLQQVYGLKFKKFVPVDIGLRYEVLDKGQADLSIIFTTDARLSTRKDIVTLEDDKHVFPPGNAIFIAQQCQDRRSRSRSAEDCRVGAERPDHPGDAGAERPRRRGSPDPA